MRVPLRPVRLARRDAPPAVPWVLALDRHPVPLMAACERIRQLAATNSQFSTTGRYAEPFISRIERIVEPALAPAQTTAAVAGPEDVRVSVRSMQWSRPATSRVTQQAPPP